MDCPEPLISDTKSYCCWKMPSGGHCAANADDSLDLEVAVGERSCLNTSSAAHTGRQLGAAVPAVLNCEALRLNRARRVSRGIRAP